MHSNWLLPGQISGDILPSKLLLSVGNEVTFQSIKSRNPTFFYGLSPCLHGWIFVRVSWHTEISARPGNCKVLLSLTTQTDTKYLKSYCRSVSYCNSLHDLMEITSKNSHQIPEVPFQWLLALSKALPGWAAQHNLQAQSSGPQGEPRTIQILPDLMDVPHFSLAFKRSRKSPFWEVPLNLFGFLQCRGVRWLEQTGLKEHCWVPGSPGWPESPTPGGKATQLTPTSGVGCTP